MAAAIDPELAALVEESWRQHWAARGEPWLVWPSAPVLFFGDLASYRASPLRVVTVALNPSHHEFPPGKPFRRFPALERPEPESPPSYIAALGRYFVEAPYRSWFGFFEEALSGAGASYYPGGRATALHTDVGSGLPTSPTWSGLSDEVRARLKSDGVFLWHDLLDDLAPDIVLWSTARQWLALLEFEPVGPWETITTFTETDAGTPRARPVPVEARWYRVGGKSALVVFAPAAQKPIGALSHRQKREVGRLMEERWRAGR